MKNPLPLDPKIKHTIRKMFLAQMLETQQNAGFQGVWVLDPPQSHYKALKELDLNHHTDFVQKKMNGLNYETQALIIYPKAKRLLFAIIEA